MSHNPCFVAPGARSLALTSKLPLEPYAYSFSLSPSTRNIGHFFYVAEIDILASVHLLIYKAP